MQPIERVLIVLCLTAVAGAHPGSGIAVDGKGQVFFVDTGRGVWKLGPGGELSLFHELAYHWMAFDERGSFAASQALGDLDAGSFERITPAGSVPALVLASDFPIVVGRDGGLYYVPFSPPERRELVRRMPDGQRSVLATLPADTSPKPMRWINGIAAAADGSLYVSDNDAIRKIGPNGVVSVLRDAIHLQDCADPLPEVPKLPYLRGLAVGRDGTVYAAANGCRALIAVPAKGPIKTLLRAERPWSPTGVALRGEEVYVLEYLHIPADDRKAWIPRVRRIAGGRVTTLVTIKRGEK